MLALGIQRRAPEHGARRHDADAAIGACRIAPLLESAKSGGTTRPVQLFGRDYVEQVLRFEGLEVAPRKPIPGM